MQCLIAYITDLTSLKKTEVSFNSYPLLGTYSDVAELESSKQYFHKRFENETQIQFLEGIRLNNFIANVRIFS